MTDTIYAWSQTAASNANSDSTINWAEYQNPSTANDSARAMMARLAELLADLAPTRSSTGSANAYAVTTAAAGSTLRNGEQITFIPNHTNTAACTLNVDGRGAKPWRPKQGTEFLADNILSGVPVTAYYSLADDAWYSAGGYYVSALASGVALQSITARLPQIGDMVLSMDSSPGAGRIRLTESTQSVLKTAYPELNAWLSARSYPFGSSATHFNLPPAAGYVLRFAATSSSIDTSGPRTAGSTQADAVRTHTHAVSAAGTTSSDGSHSHVYAAPTITGTTDSTSGVSLVGSSTNTLTGEAGAHTHTVTVTGTASAHSGATTENRVKNVAYHVDVVASTALAAAQVAVFGFPLQWDTGTTAADPGAGRIRGNDTTLASITALYVSTSDGWGVNITDVLTGLSTGNVLHLSKVGAQANRITATVSSTPTAATGYVIVPVTIDLAAGSLSSNDQMAFEYSKGTQGPQGDEGPSVGLDYAWAVATSGDPGSGNILANNVTLSSATAVHISKTGASGQSFGTYLATWDDSTSTIKGHLSIYTLTDRAEYIEADVTGITDNSTYYTVAISNVAAAGTPTAADTMVVMFVPKGDKGDTGATGATGPTGSTGATGPAWDQWQGAWLTATAYAVNDAVENDGSSYICTSGHTSGAGTEPGVGASWATVWDLVAAKGADGAGTGDVTAASGFGTDNSIIRADGTSKGVQASALTIADTSGTIAGFADASSFNDSSGNELIKFAVTASAVNELTVRNQATGSAPAIEASGGDTNININIKPKGSGSVTVDGKGAIGRSPTIQSFTSGSGTYTTPAGVLWIEVEMIGGGGGAAGSGSGSGSGSAGGNTTFGSAFLTCNGGSGGTAASGTGGGTGGTATGGDINQQGGPGGNASTGTSSIAVFGGAGAASMFAGGGSSGFGANPGNAATANSGAGGGGGGANSTISGGGCGGGAGGYLRKIIDAPSSTYAYAVGSGGGGGTAGTSGQAGGAGGSGRIVVREYYA